jgi:tripartite-type tricarboxylate transporter receptor subunit TctC
MSDDYVRHLQVRTDPDFIAKLAQIGIEAAKATTPSEVRSFVASERKKWNPIVDKAGIAQK